MSNLRLKENTITVGGKTFNILLTLSVVERLQEVYEDLEKVIEIIADNTKFTKALSEIAVFFINDDIDCHNDDCPNKWEHVTPKWLQRRIVLQGEAAEGKILVADIAKAILNAFKIPMSDGDVDPNPEATL